MYNFQVVKIIRYPLFLIHPTNRKFPRRLWTVRQFPKWSNRRKNRLLATARVRHWHSTHPFSTGKTRGNFRLVWICLSDCCKTTPHFWQFCCRLWRNTNIIEPNLCQTTVVTTPSVKQNVNHQSKHTFSTHFCRCFWFRPRRQTCRGQR